MWRKAHCPSLIFLVCVLLASLAVARPAVAQQQKNFLWRVQSKTATAYILGSVHFLKPENYPLNPVIERAFERSSVLAVEANVNDPGKLDLQGLMDRVFYPENDGLDKHVSREAYQYIENQMGKLGLPLEMVSRQRPWFLALTFEALELMRLGFDPQYGIDMHFLSKAQGAKSIVELESLDEQINMLSGFSDVEQEAFLVYTLKNLKALGPQSKEVVRAWTAGDTRAIESVVSQSVREEPRLVTVLRRLLDDRNRKMASKIEGYLRSGQTYFVVVGAGHLVGDKGILKALTDKGFLVQQL